MNYYLIAPTARVHSDGYFTYSSEKDLKIGSIVMVEIGKKKSPGVVIEKTKKPSFKTKPIIEAVEARPLPKPLLHTAYWLEKYYNSPISNVWQTLLPRGLSKKRRESNSKPHISSRKKPTFSLNSAQENAVKKIFNSKQTTTLLQGVTGSGKTAVYIELAKKILFEDKKSVIILVPEIALTSQLVSEFTHHFDNILLTHSRMTEAQRHIIWQAALHSKTPRLVIGPRSALFMPLSHVGLIVIDEAHEPSFKQEQSPRYSALRAASVLATHHKAKLVLGTATPSVVDRYLAEHSSGEIVYLPHSAKKTGSVDIELIDNRKRKHFTKHQFLSNELIEAMEKTLEKKQQILIFHNRRGSAPTTLCENCGWIAICSHCFIPLTLHSDAFELRCHVCGLTENVPTNCPECNTANVIHKGIGTKRIFEEVSKKFPHANIARFDSDSTHEDRLESQYKALYDGDIDIIIGTQTVAKGLDLPKLSLVGVIQADGGLSLPDFVSEERVFHLLYQVMGRVGRDDKLSTIIVQTYQPDHITIQSALSKDYENFYTYAVAKRKHDMFPPFCYLLKLTCTYASEKAAMKASLELKKKLQYHAQDLVTILGPTPAFYEKVRGSYRWQLIVKSPKREELVKLLHFVPAAKWQSELDPVSLL